MSRKDDGYTEGPIDKIPDDKLVRVPNFLPPPEVLARAPVRVKITIKLTLETINFFKEAAEKHNTQYQRLIRQVLDEYVAHYKQLDETETKPRKSKKAR